MWLPGLAFLRAIDAAEADAFMVVAVQDLEGVAVEDLWNRVRAGRLSVARVKIVALALVQRMSMRGFPLALIFLQGNGCIDASPTYVYYRGLKKPPKLSTAVRHK
jgi:hypothetical protein